MLISGVIVAIKPGHPLNCALSDQGWCPNDVLLSYVPCALNLCYMARGTLGSHGEISRCGP